MCGGTLDLSPGLTAAACPYCGSLTTFPNLNDEKCEQLYNRAEHFRRLNDFDKAVDAYESLLREDDSDPEAYWGLVLSRYGIEYVQDPVTGERIPTCHRVQFESILADPDYQMALKKSSGMEQDLYEKEAQRIAEIQKGILAISAQEKPFDVFICYKETTDGGTRTKDSVVAQDIYYQLVNAGYKVFFARITLEDKLGQQYEPYIFAALNSAKVMLVIGSKKEYFEATWVRNEWSRFLALMKKDRSKLLIPCYKEMDAYEIPQELSMLQSQDMSKIGFIQDLLRGIKKVVNLEGATAKAAPVTAGDEVTPLLKRIKIFLAQRDWDSAARYCDRVLDINPEIGTVYIYKIMAEKCLTTEEQLVELSGLADMQDFQLALRFSDEQEKQRLNAIVRKQYQQTVDRIKTRLEGIDIQSSGYEETVNALAEANDLLNKQDEPGIAEAVARLKQRIYEYAFSVKETNMNEAELWLQLLPDMPEAVELLRSVTLQNLPNKGRIVDDFFNMERYYRELADKKQDPFFLEVADKCWNIAAAAIYRHAEDLAKNGKFDDAADMFKQIPAYADAAKKAALCHKCLNMTGLSMVGGLLGFIVSSGLGSAICRLFDSLPLLAIIFGGLGFVGGFVVMFITPWMVSRKLARRFYLSDGGSDNYS